MHAVVDDVAIVLLAAGGSRRFGALKQLQVLEQQTLVRRAALTALATGCTLHVVTGAEHARVAAELSGLPLQQIHIPGWSRGMGHSLSAAVRALQGASPAPQALLILLADQPLVGADDLQAILREHRLHPEAIVAADHGAVLGPPCLFPATWFDALAALDGDRGARGLLQQHRDAVIAVTMPRAAVDVDTPDDLARVIETLRESGA